MSDGCDSANQTNVTIHIKTNQSTNNNNHTSDQWVTEAAHVKSYCVAKATLSSAAIYWEWLVAYTIVLQHNGSFKSISLQCSSKSLTTTTALIILPASTDNVVVFIGWRLTECKGESSLKANCLLTKTVCRPILCRKLYNSFPRKIQESTACGLKMQRITP